MTSARVRVKRSSAGRAPGRSSIATTTSLSANPVLRSVNTIPVSAGHTASDSSARGMRLIAALVIGIARKTNSGESRSGR